MTVVRVTKDDDATGFELSVEPLPDGKGLIATEKGGHGFGPGQLTKVYVDGKVHWAQRRSDRLALLTD